MATLDRRVQILLDPEQYSALERESVERGRSVAAIIREAIDARVGASVAKRRTALDQFLARADGPDGPQMKEWDEIKAEIEEDLYGNWPR